MTDLQEKIAHIIEKYGPHDPEATAAAVIAALESAPQAGGDVRELVEALRPFADAANEFDEDEPDDPLKDCYGNVLIISVRDLRRARAALTATPAQPTPSEDAND